MEHKRNGVNARVKRSSTRAYQHVAAYGIWHLAARMLKRALKRARRHLLACLSTSSSAAAATAMRKGINSENHGGGAT